MYLSVAFVLLAIFGVLCALLEAGDRCAPPSSAAPCWKSSGTRGTLATSFRSWPTKFSFVAHEIELLSDRAARLMLDLAPYVPRRQAGDPADGLGAEPSFRNGDRLRSHDKEE
jgi:hypothetical protein